MANLSSFLGSIFNPYNKNKLKEFQSIVKKINEIEINYNGKSQSELISFTDQLKVDFKNGVTLDELLVPAFAIVREAAKQTLNQRHFDVQLLGGLVLHNGAIAEMKTGEGKTLVSTLPAFLNAISGKGVHIVTVNEYLAKRDSEWMGKIFKFLGLSVGCISSEIKTNAERKSMYQCDITYGTNNEFGFDYLRDNLKLQKDHMVQRDHNFCIVDEVDSILIDESRTPLVISGAIEDKTVLYNTIDSLVPNLKPEDYEIDEKSKSVNLSEIGVDTTEKILLQRNLMKSDSLYDVENVTIVHHVNQALRAHKLFEKDSDYIVKDGQVIIIDEFTGRMMEGRRYGDGLHQAIEAKEKVSVQSESQTVASITFQNYFRLYKKISGMTGTALTEAEEFSDIYNLLVFDIPTNQPVTRKDQQDVIFRTSDEKYDAIIDQIFECYDKKQPVLIGTTSIEKSEKISKILSKKKIKHSVLNAKQHEQEAEIISNAGYPGAVTIATNMAGRGTDIQLGGNLEFAIDQKDIDVAKLTSEIENNKKLVLAAGGLYVIGSERHESRRIDNQLRGRSGRQGDPGETKFFLSLEDDLMRIFGSDKMDGMLKTLGLSEGESIQHSWITKALERAQKKVEGRNFDIRKTLLKFDDVLNDQRKNIFEQRLDLMDTEEITETINEMQYDTIDEFLDFHIPKDSYVDQWDINGLESDIKNHLAAISDIKALADKDGFDKDQFKEHLYALVRKKSIMRAEGHSKESVENLERMVLLRILDDKWKDHINNLEQLRQTIGLRGYGQRDPLSEYKNESFVLFENLLSNLKIDVTKTFSRLVIKESSKVDKTEEEFIEGSNESQNPLKKEKVSRNSPCPCGSGKKYKHCHGKI
ncbi:MAG: preprotein translocase subunit SecA [Candidatus Pelagibacterales bacterium]|tara:strand:+ start:4541 stop:7141 length:2601 start_codon:yes stop_codon:yes gene_type:complete